MSDTKEKEYISVDWLIKILVGIVAFFLVCIFLTVQKTASDVSDLKVTIGRLQDRYDVLNNRIKLLEIKK